MTGRSASDLRVDSSLEFVCRHLPAGRCPILDAGCGEGRLVQRLADAGHDAAGVDSSPEAVAAARAARRNVRETDFLQEAGSYDAVLFGASLHHMFPLDAAVDRAAALLRPGGVVIADEFDVVSPDRDTAQWFFHVMDALEAAGLVSPAAAHHDDPLIADPGADPLRRWEARHRHDPPFSTGRQMLDALAARFEIVCEERCPYLAWYALGDLDEAPRGRRIGERLIALERRLVEAGRVLPVGLRIVARSGSV